VIPLDHPAADDPVEAILAGAAHPSTVSVGGPNPLDCPGQSG
jgi:hypothetical protein